LTIKKSWLRHLDLVSLPPSGHKSLDQDLPKVLIFFLN
jgi:hypothetical protein